MGKLIDKVHDPMGSAISEFWETGKSSRLRVFSPMFDEDEIPVDVLFRRWEKMSSLEQEALRMAKGHTLDVGAGAGCHSLVLQERGITVDAIDISPLSVDTMRKRGVVNARLQDLYDVKEQYETILMLMNGIGIVGTLSRLARFFRLLDAILLPYGQLLCDSTDISYLFDQGIPPSDLINYYGELQYKMQYRDVEGNSFGWLYIDENTLCCEAKRYGYDMQVVSRGEHYDYLARIIKK